MTPRGPARLLVLVSPGCAECGRAVQIAADFQAKAPGVDVRIIDVTVDAVPNGVILVGTPMYIDDTTTPTILSLGNPTPSDLDRHYRSEP